MKVFVTVRGAAPVQKKGSECKAKISIRFRLWPFDDDQVGKSSLIRVLPWDAHRCGPGFDMDFEVGKYYNTPTYLIS